MAQAENPTDIIVVLGSRTNEDGSVTEMMKSRVKRAAELYSSLKQQNIDCHVIVTGYQAPDQVIDSCPYVPSTFRILQSFMVSLMVVLLIASYDMANSVSRQYEPNPASTVITCPSGQNAVVLTT